MKSEMLLWSKSMVSQRISALNYVFGIWMNALESPPRKLFVVHGESESAKHFGEYVSEKTGWDVMVPVYLDEAVLD